MLRVVNQGRESVKNRRDAGRVVQARMPFGYALESGIVKKHHQHWRHARWLVEQLIRQQLNYRVVLRALPDDFPRHYSSPGLKRWLLNPMLRGGVGVGEKAGRYERIDWHLDVPVLIPPDQWNLIELMIAKRRRIKGDIGPGRSYLLTGVIKCQACKKNLHHRPPQTVADAAYERYVCRSPGCKWYGRTLRADVVVPRIHQALTRLAQSMALDAEAWANQPHIESARELELKEQLSNLEQLDGDGVPGLRKAIVKLRGQLLRLKPLPPGEIILPNYRELFSKPETFAAASEQEMRVLILTYVDQVIYQGQPDAFAVRLRGRDGRQISP